MCVHENVQIAQMQCRKCKCDNPMVYYAPVYPNQDGVVSVICFDCAVERGWVDKSTGNLKQGVEL